MLSAVGGMRGAPRGTVVIGWMICPGDAETDEQFRRRVWDAIGRTRIVWDMDGETVTESANVMVRRSSLFGKR